MNPGTARAPLGPALNDPALYGRFLRGLSLRPEGDALRVGTERITYEAAHELALSWAGSIPVDPADAGRSTVGVLAAKGLVSYVGLLAVLYAGATVVPLNPAFPVARTRQMLEAAEVSAVVVDERGMAVMDELADAGVKIPVLAPVVAGVSRGGAGTGTFRPGPALDRPRPVGPGDLAYILFTSGSTGRPKGVPITHGNTHHYFTLMDARYGFTPEDVFSQTFDLNFDCAMFDLFCAWGAGATVQAVPPAAYRSMPDFVAERGLTVWFSTPSGIGLVRRMGGLTPDAMPGLRWSLFAGEALKAADASAWLAAASASTVENIYGPTELTVTVSGYRWSPDASPSRCVNGLVPIGTLHNEHDHLLLDAFDHEVECEPGAEGELCIAGPQLTPGYLNPTDDEGRFLDRYGKRWYRTGDRVRRHPDGVLVYLGRLDSQVQVQGVRVELAEIEQAVRADGGAEDAVAVAVTTGRGTELAVFYTGAVRPAAELAQRLRATLPEAMLPRFYRHLAEFPLNSNGKTDRSLLARLAAELV